jgi:hypothetical protein
MSDGEVIPQNASNILNSRPAKLGAPVYLVIYEDPTVKQKYSVFIASKFEEFHITAKLIGFETTGTIANAIENYSDIIKAQDKSKYMEVSIPWSRIIKVHSLSWRPKLA